MRERFEKFLTNFEVLIKTLSNQKDAIAIIMGVNMIWMSNMDVILFALQNFDCHCLFANKTVHQQVNLLSNIILNVFKKFVLNKFITCDDRDPPWINDNIRNKIKWKNSMHKYYMRSDRKSDEYDLLTEAVSEVFKLIEKS